jgi:hypothetical protein
MPIRRQPERVRSPKNAAGKLQKGKGAAVGKDDKVGVANQADPGLRGCVSGWSEGLEVAKVGENSWASHATLACE